MKTKTEIASAKANNTDSLKPFLRKTALAISVATFSLGLMPSSSFAQSDNNSNNAEKPKSFGTFVYNGTNAGDLTPRKNDKLMSIFAEYKQEKLPIINNNPSFLHSTHQLSHNNSWNLETLEVIGIRNKIPSREILPLQKGILTAKYLSTTAIGLEAADIELGKIFQPPSFSNPDKKFGDAVKFSLLVSKKWIADRLIGDEFMIAKSKNSGGIASGPIISMGHPDKCYPILLARYSKIGFGYKLAKPSITFTFESYLQGGAGFNIFLHF